MQRNGKGLVEILRAWLALLLVRDDLPGPVVGYGKQTIHVDAWLGWL